MVIHERNLKEPEEPVLGLVFLGEEGGECASSEYPMYEVGLPQCDFESLKTAIRIWQPVGLPLSNASASTMRRLRLR